MSMTARGDEEVRNGRGVVRLFGRRARGVGVMGLLLLGAGACSSGSSGVPSPPGTKVGPLCTTRDPGPSPLRRLSRVEYARTMEALLGPGALDSTRLPPDERALGFANNAEVESTGGLLVEAYADLAEQAGDWVAAHSATYAPCAATTPDATCAAAFVADFGRRAWRRPPTSDEQVALAAVYAAGETDGAFAEGLARVTAVLLSSPQFLYRIESGSGVPSDELAGAVPLTPNELATRLSYLVWGSMPDRTLLDAVDGGKLTTPADLSREARRMLADPRAHDMVATFHAQWLGLDQLGAVSKDAIIYPMFTPELSAAFSEETAAFVDEVIWNREGTLGALLSAPYTFGDASLAAFYGAGPPTTTTSGLGLIALPVGQRAGLLTQGAFLSVYGKANQSDPIHRGRFVRERLFCTTPPSPPPNIAVRPPDLDPRLTTRQRFAAHTGDPMCAGCHKLLDPIGFSFEHYDGIGRWRDMEGGQPVDSSGALSGTDVDRSLDSAVTLATAVAESSEVQVCYATQWFRFAYGRGETDADACTVSDLANALVAAQGNVRELLVALTQTDAFRYRRAGDLLQ